MNPTIKIGDQIREMTDTEYAEWSVLGAELETRRQAELAKIESAKTVRNKLAALGLTDDEINALIR